MKILHIVTQGERGGAQAHVRDVVRSLEQKGHQTYVATGAQYDHEDKWLFHELQSSGFKPHQLRIIPSLSRDVSFWKDCKAALETIKLVRAIKPDIVHVHSSKAGSVCAVAARLAGAKVVYTVHGFVFTEPMGKIKKYFYIISELISRFFRNYTITVSRFDYEVGRYMHIIPKRKGSVIYNGIDEKNVRKSIESKPKITILCRNCIEHIKNKFKV